jgi:signal transduction histidine kinase
VTQDPSGFIYIANGVDARCYDGATWRLIKLPTESAGIRKFAVTAGGVVYLAGAGVLGYFRGSGPSAQYVSLADRLPAAAGGYDDIYDVLAVGNTVYFADEAKILVWQGGAFTVIPYPTPAHGQGARLHRVGETVYVTALQRPLCRLERGRLEPVAENPVLRENQIITLEAGPAGGLVLLTASRGFFQLHAGEVTPLPAEANRWLAGKTILRALRWDDGSFAVAFTAVSGDGGMRFDAGRRYLGPIDQSIGLYVRTLRDFCLDRQGGLWIASETGMFRLNWPSPATVFDGVNGLGQGPVADVARHEGALYAATTEGVYRLAASDDRDGRCAHFERIFNFPAYSLLSHPGGLLIAGYADLFVVTAAGLSSVAKLPPGGGSLFSSKRDPDRVWISTTRGLQSVRYTGGGWRTQSADAAAPETPEPTDRPALHLPALITETAGPIAREREEGAGDHRVLWICAARGLVRVDLARGFPAPVPFATLLTTAEVGEGERVPLGPNSLKFGYVALRHQLADEVVYQTRLTGRDRDWSPWSPARESIFTDLPAGTYRFEVRARDADGELAAPAARAFVVLAPWWLTRWAMGGYLALSLAAIFGLVRLLTRALRLRAARLENIVAERTSELAQKNHELVRLNRLESEEKIAARLAEEKASLEVLRYQLNPHFLYNTLGSIGASLPADAAGPRAMVARLAEFCRLTLHRPAGQGGTTLGDEVRLLRTYLEIERSRWGDLLDLEISCDPALEDEPLPHFLLLPLVENALKYGRATSVDRVGLRLTIRREPAGAMVLEVANTGEWVEPSGIKNVASLGIGLENLRQRLARYYPRAHELRHAAAGGWVTVTLRLAPGSVSSDL